MSSYCCPSCRNEYINALVVAEAQLSPIEYEDNSTDTLTEIHPEIEPYLHPNLLAHCPSCNFTAPLSKFTSD